MRPSRPHPPPYPPLDLTPASYLQYRERGRSVRLVVVPRQRGPVRRLETTDGEVIAEQTGAQTPLHPHSGEFHAPHPQPSFQYMFGNRATSGQRRFVTLGR